MQIMIVFCEFCDKVRYPEEFIKLKGKCPNCKRETKRIALFDTDGGVGALLEKGKVK